MKIINKYEAGEWCRAHGIPLDGKGLPDVGNIPGTEKFPIPNDAGKRTALVREQMTSLLSTPSCLVWLDDWSVWPSGQWHQLFERFRLSYGSREPLIEKPAHIIEKDEIDAAISIAVYAVLMLWDCYVITDAGRWIYYSHDEFGLKRNGRQEKHVRLHKANRQ